MLTALFLERYRKRCPFGTRENPRVCATETAQTTLSSRYASLRLRRIASADRDRFRP